MLWRQRRGGEDFRPSLLPPYVLEVVRLDALEEPGVEERVAEVVLGVPCTSAKARVSRHIQRS
jgi:hypothetical protein